MPAAFTLRIDEKTLEALDHLADRTERSRAAERTIARIISAIDRLPLHSEIGRPGRIAGTRELVIPGTPYLAPYRIREGEVQILSIFHGFRRWPEHFG